LSCLNSLPPSPPGLPGSQVFPAHSHVPLQRRLLASLPIQLFLARLPRIEPIDVPVIHTKRRRDQNRIVYLHIRRALHVGRSHLLAALLHLRCNHQQRLQLLRDLRRLKSAFTRFAINLIYDELVGNGTDGPALDRPRTASGSSLSESENPVVAVAQVSSERAPGATVERAETTEAKPALGVVLEFATRMRQSRGREVLLNAWICWWT
jgi:hypothetical protein